MSETIFAIASGLGASAVAIVRISGPEAWQAVVRMCSDRPCPRVATLVEISDPENLLLIDRGMVLWFPAPSSFTGEDSVEFHVHGGPAVKTCILRALERLKGFRHANPGEFTRRAFLNGKLDLTEAEGLSDLISAETELQLRQALGSARGSLRARVGRWREVVVEALALVSAEIDFSDEGDVSKSTGLRQLEEKLSPVVADIREVLDGSVRGEMVREGFRVAICGPPNAGKSSLLNWLARREVAIVSPEAGTTRDLVEVGLNIRGLPVRLIDTAGIRSETGGVESEGIQRALRSGNEADLVLWLFDEGKDAEPVGNLRSREVLRVSTKRDLKVGQIIGQFSISAVTGDGIDDLLIEIERIARSSMMGSGVAIANRERHRVLLKSTLEALVRAMRVYDAPELVAEELWYVTRRLDGVVGQVDVEEVLGEIFSRFCIGK